MRRTGTRIVTPQPSPPRVHSMQLQILKKPLQCRTALAESPCHVKSKRRRLAAFPPVGGVGFLSLALVAAFVVVHEGAVFAAFAAFGVVALGLADDPGERHGKDGADGADHGDVVVLAAAKEKKVLSEVNVSAPVYSTAIVANNTLYLASQTHLFAIAEGAKPVEPKDKK